ncbi:hypothetical protein BCS42_05860 [Crenothrix sp. D3]|jgi:ABC-type anion transport system duplicated permease subunit|nr:hypothetical protein BCS42_05860 [Crenothrix sp. D3]
MKKRKNPQLLEQVTLQNPVAKFARQFNKACVFADKNQYRRTPKHRKQEASLIILTRMIKAVFCFSATKSAYCVPHLI